jgi:hypothetical protein
MIFFVCVFYVMYSGEYNVFDVTLSVYPHRAGWKVSLTTVGIEPTTFWILVPCSAKSSTFDTNVFYDHDIFWVCFDVICIQVNIMFLMLLWVYIHTAQAE